MEKKFGSIFVDKARSIYGNEFIPLHRPVFEGNERQYLIDCIDLKFVSYVGLIVTIFESKASKFTGSKYAAITVNGTADFHAVIELERVKSIYSDGLTNIIYSG